MDMESLNAMNLAWLVWLVGGLVVVAGFVAMVMKFYVKVNQGQALIVNTLNDIKVTFSGAVVLPIIYRAEVMDISLKTVEIDRRGKEGLICRDNIRADIKVTFFVRINKTREDVLRVAQSVGCERASDQDKIEELFVSKFSEALKTVGKQLDFESLYQERVHFREKIIEIIGQDLNGYVLEDAAIDFLEQTPVESLDANNILDAQGIRKITELTSEQRFRTNEFANKAKKDIGKDDLETQMAMLEYERQEAEAVAKQNREIAVVQAREKAEARELTAKEDARAQIASLKAQQEIEVQGINKLREEEVAQKNRERVIAVESEAVEKERQLQIIARERETELQRIEKEKELEVERKNIAEILRDRVAVDKTVAEEEERIKDLRVIAEAERMKKSAIVAAEGEAEEALVKDIKRAEAQEAAAVHDAKRRVIEADAELDAAERTARAKKLIAEGIEAEEAALGLAQVRVKEADAQANEKQGMVDIRLKEADADANEKQGMVEVRLKEADADATQKLRMVEVHVKEAAADANEKQGLVDARVLRERLLAEAEGNEQRGLVEARVLKEKLLAEAEGLGEKAEAMKRYDADTLAFEQYQMQLDLERVLGLEQLEKSVDIADAQAKVFGDALKAADMTIVGGQEAFFESFSRAISVGKMVEGVLDTSPTARDLVDGALKGLGRRARSKDEEAPANQERDAGQIDPKMVADLTPGE